MKKTILLTIVLTFMSLQVYGQLKFEEKDKIFDGKTFTNWVVPENNIWWEIDSKGILSAISDPTKTGSTLWSEEKYNDFAIRLEFKMIDGIVDSGIFMRGESSENVQIQIGISGSLKRDMTASPYVPKKGYPIEALKDHTDLLKQKDWNSLEVHAIANHYYVWLNGLAVLDYSLKNANLIGPVGLQLHPGKTMNIQFKNIFLKTL